MGEAEPRSGAYYGYPMDLRTTESQTQRGESQTKAQLRPYQRQNAIEYCAPRIHTLESYSPLTKPLVGSDGEPAFILVSLT